ncbi:hypothetical protein GCM10022223_14580 [Kineosporia mesophila]|uniref:Uncharacterized protein n=1 Tax=Kineosporia mesophila TaxID=566012 RepID=A0ABP6Z6Q3_9ACTN|nr:hypothetical protein [Kineosporia mesophila]MCD5352936.1 hypothetical protein [Kineosporia mesophila]
MVRQTSAAAGPRPGTPTAIGPLTAERRLIATPWSRMVRALGLGQDPTGPDPQTGQFVRETFAALVRRVGGGNPYTVFCAGLADLVLEATAPGGPAGQEAGRRLPGLLAAAGAEPNAYYRLTALCLLAESWVKCGLDSRALTQGGPDLPGLILATLDQIRPDQIQDENRGRHGQYERLSASTSAFLAVGHLGVAHRLVQDQRDRVREALGLLEQIPAPFFRGRGGSMLMSVTAALGRPDLVNGQDPDGGPDHLRATLDYLDRAGEINLPPAFPSPMTPAFGQIYPLLTMLNAVAAVGRPQILDEGRDRLAQADELYRRLAPAERTHMGLYLLIALHNLGRLAERRPEWEDEVTALVGQWREGDPGADYFLHGISYPYLIETARLTGRTDLLPEAMLVRLAGASIGLERSAEHRANRPYPFSYAVSTLGALNRLDLLSTPDRRYDGQSATSWVIDRLSPGGRAEGNRLYMLDHALVHLALRQRDPARAEPALFAGFRFAADR